MVRAQFYRKNGSYIGFSLSGHSGYAERGSDVVCAAVSSAVQLTANALDEFGAEPEISVGDNIIRCRAGAISEEHSRMIALLKVHLEAVLEEFPGTIKITISEV